ncbi:hypothetical protein BDN70DRAFT_832435 [Pholiota conissans]|uniref:Ubinuclein middle domain-containing protein n=1 Tax=Pholiota conissans TaxID=109636 RepID=A0A9P6D2G3_9AGAR|nr:hypothetical protein BDN70DRAFT_832435 [Pholiota conissans]
MPPDVDMAAPNAINIHNPAPSASGAGIPIPLLVHSPSPAPHDVKRDSASAPPLPAGSAAASTSTAQSASLPPPPSSAASGTSAKPTSSAKPKSKAAKARSPSPSPPPPPAPPLQTIRLDIRLGGPSNYEVDIGRQAKDTGQRPPTPPPTIKKVADSSDSEEDEEEKKDGTKKKKRKKNTVPEYYDTSDPFIDDSELALDQRQFFAQTKQQGFYVSSGEVALLKDKSTKKPKAKKISFAAGLHPSLNPQSSVAISTPGTRDAPIPIDDGPHSTALADADMNTAAAEGHAQILREGGVHLAADAVHVGQKRKRPGTATTSVVLENGKRKKVVDEKMFHPDLQKAIAELRVLIKQESWENKGKFPPALKPALAKLAILAIRLDEYDDDFFSLMPTLFPYNKFTMSKLIKRTVFGDHLTLLTERQDVLLAQLGQLARDGFKKAEEEWERSVVAWDKRQEKSRQEAAEASTGTGSGAPTRHPTEEMDVDGPTASQDGKDGKDGEGGKESANHPPAKRYRMTDQMKAIVWELVLLSNECCRLENEKNQLEGSVIQVSDQGLRKVLYQKIVAAYPEGWMSSGQISRDVSAMKKRLEREAMEQGDDD